MIGRRALLAAGTAFAISKSFPGNAETSAADTRIDELAAAVRSKIAAPGMAYGVVRDRRPALRRGLGVRELGKQDAVTSQTLFHMASVTKPFVATLLAQRVEQRRLRLDQRLVEALPEFRPADPRARAITLEQVLTHSSGLPDVDDDGYGWDHPETDADALRRYVAGLSNLTLLFAPGTDYAYSNIGFEILARVIEVLDGVTFETAMRRAIFHPLKMNRSTLFYPEVDKKQLAAPHVADAHDNVYPSPVFPYNRPHAGSSTLLSCVDDMLRWIRFNLGDGTLDGVRILSLQTLRDLHAPRAVLVKSDRYPPGTRPALSWFVTPTPGAPILMHGGDDVGFVSVCLFCPAEGCGMVAMANCETADATMTLRNFALAAHRAGLLAAAL